MDAPVRNRRSILDNERLAIKRKLRDIAEAEQPVTCRRLFYRILTADIPELRSPLEKTEGTCDMVTRYLAEMRLNSLTGTDPWIPFEWITDNTREAHSVLTFSGLPAILDAVRGSYRRSVFDNQDALIELWVEKDGLLGVFAPIMDEYPGLKVVPVSGHCLGFLYDQAKVIRQDKRPTRIFYFGDSDGYGEEIQENIEKKFALFGADTTFERLAVTQNQIAEYNLPTRPPKGRAAQRVDQAVEVDAMNPDDLRALARDAVNRHFDSDRLDELREVEQREQQWLDRSIGRAMKDPKRP